MTLSNFLRGDPASPEPPWRIERREPEGGGWHPVATATEEGVARDEGFSPREPYAYGALVRLRNPRDRLVALWVNGREGLLEAGTVPPALRALGEMRDALGDPLDWMAAWEGPEAYPPAMMQAAMYADRRRLVLAACACAEDGLAVLEARGVLPLEETRPRRAIETARAWAGGKADLDAVRAAEQAARAAATLLPDEYRYGGPLGATLAALATAFERGVAQYSGEAVTAAEESCNYYLGRQDRAAARLRLAALLRQPLPLPVVLLSLLDEPTPLSLGF